MPSTIVALTPDQEQVLALLSAGSTVAAAAETAGVHRNTVGYWRRSSPAFRQALDHATYEKAMFWRDQFEILAPAALAVMRHILAHVDTPASVRLKAALPILGKTSTPLPPMLSLVPAPEPVHSEIVHKNAQTPEPITTVTRLGPKIGRNDPCPCGSNKKFKRRCGADPLLCAGPPGPALRIGSVSAPAVGLTIDAEATLGTEPAITPSEVA